MQDFMSSLSQPQYINQKKEKGEMEAQKEVRLIKTVNHGTGFFAVNLDGKEFEFVGHLYPCEQDWSLWAHGVCPDCGKVDGCTSIGAKIHYFCLEHMKAWEGGIDCWGDFRKNWYRAENVEEKNTIFLKEFQMVGTQTSEAEVTQIIERCEDDHLRQEAIIKLYEKKPLTVKELFAMALRVPEIEMRHLDDCTCGICPVGNDICYIPPYSDGDKETFCKYYLGYSRDEGRILCIYNLKDRGELIFFDDYEPLSEDFESTVYDPLPEDCEANEIERMAEEQREQDFQE